MDFKFSDYLHDACNSAFYSRTGFMEPTCLLNVDDFRFTFMPKFDIKRVEEQADIFALRGMGMIPITTLLNINAISNVSNKAEKLRQVYIYSYLKAYHYSVLCYERRGSYVGNPGEGSYCFGGHTELYRIVLDSNFTGRTKMDGSKTVVFKKVILSKEDINEFRNCKYHDMFGIDVSKEDIYFSPEYERILTAFRTDCSVLWVTSLTLIDRLDRSDHPLGNTCFVNDPDKKFTEVMCVNNFSIANDVISKYWNIANSIFMHEVDSKFERCEYSPYSYFRKSDLPRYFVYAEVHSITMMPIVSYFAPHIVDDKPNDGYPQDDRPHSPEGPKPSEGDKSSRPKFRNTKRNGPKGQPGMRSKYVGSNSDSNPPPGNKIVKAIVEALTYAVVMYRDASLIKASAQEKMAILGFNITEKELFYKEDEEKLIFRGPFWSFESMTRKKSSSKTFLNIKPV